jgi:hypothetical protein
MGRGERLERVGREEDERVGGCERKKWETGRVERVG